MRKKFLMALRFFVVFCVQMNAFLAGNALADERNLEVVPAGFYIYPYHIEAVANRAGYDYKIYADELMKKLTSHGFSLHHLTTQDFDFWLYLAEKYNFQIIAQIDSAYLSKPSMEEVYAKAPTAIDFIKRYKNNQRIIAFSVIEEPSFDLMPFVYAYYKLIKLSVPDARLFLLHNNKKALEYPIENGPSSIGTDRYAFWGWDSGAGGYSATPFSALNWYRSDMKYYSDYAKMHRAVFVSVFTSVGNIKITTKAEVESWRYGDPDRIFELAKSKNQGWTFVGDSMLRYVKYYRPPENCTRAMVWLSILNGAKMVLHWSGNPTDLIEKNIIENELYIEKGDRLLKKNQETIDAIKKGSYSLRILEPNLESTKVFKEYASSNTEIQKYAWIINRMFRTADETMVGFSDGLSSQNMFDLPGYRGKILVVVNINVGTWDSDSIKSLVKSNSKFRIDHLCNLLNYEPKVEPQKLSLRYNHTGDLWNIEKGKRLGHKGRGEVSVAPGGGILLFIGEEEELLSLRKRAGFF
jgi:hypothetical protein